MSEGCDGSGYIETPDERGFLVQRPCQGTTCHPGDAAFQGAQGGAESVTVGADTLLDLQHACAVVRGTVGAEPTMSSEVAWGLILSYLPALIEMSRLWMMAQDSEPFKVSVSAHPLSASGLDATIPPPML